MSEGLGQDFDRAQARYDAQTPEDHTDCDGIYCRHRWRFIGEAKDGTRFSECIWCGRLYES